MAHEDMTRTRYASAEELIAALKLESDDFDKFVIPSMPVFRTRDPETGEVTEHYDVGMIICRSNGTQVMIHHEDASRFLMDCLKNRRQIPVVISPTLRDVP